MAYPAPLLEQHEHAGATVLPYGRPDAPILVPATFGELEFEYAALRKACVLIDWPHRGTLSIAGEDRHAFLNNMITQELKGLQQMESRRAFWLSRKGRVVADLRLTNLGDRLHVDLDAHAVASTIETLGSYVITEDVEIADQTQAVHRLALHGPTGPRLLDMIGTFESGGAAELAPGRAAWCEIAGVRVLLERQDTTGEIGIDLTVPAESVGTVYGALVRAGSMQQDQPPASAQEIKLREAGWLAFNTARIEAGTPMFNLDFGTDTLPAETGEATLRDRVSFTKGCYLGQEVVARMHSLGKPKQTLVALRLEGDTRLDREGLARQPVGGAPVVVTDTEASVGAVTSSTISPMLGGEVAAFAMVRTKALDDGTPLSVAAEGVQVPVRVQTELSYYSGGKK